MIQIFFHHYIFHLRKLVSFIFLAFLSFAQLYSASPLKYAESSVLSSGNWVKINISQPGLQTLSRQTLKNFGFNDPDKVFVYGYGGRMISEALHPDLPDDLPHVPFIRRADGSITFYAAGTIAIQPSSGSDMAFGHSINPYSDDCYYFLSDIQPAQSTDIIDLSSISGMKLEDSFTCQLVHERDLMQCAESGRNYLGEDFRSSKSQDFKFNLSGNIDGNARIRVKFGANTTGAPSSILISANGQRLPATTNDKIAAVTSSDQYYKTTSTFKDAKDVGNTLTVGIEYSQGGVVTIARLDWIEVEYEKELKLKDAQLYFHVNPTSPAAYRISGVSPNAVAWDITDPYSIKEVKGLYNSSDNSLTIGVPDSGLREFMIVEPEANGATVAGKSKVANQNIHALTTPDMVIICPDVYLSAAERIANLHRHYDNMTVHVLSPDKIYNEFSGGNPDVSAFRKLLKMWYDRGISDPEQNQIKYCLLMGRPTFDQKCKNQSTIKAGYPTTLIWQSTGSLSETSSFCTDDFIGMLEDETIERSLPLRNINVGVGRYPVTSLAEANIIADKLEAYVSSPDYGFWRNNVMVIADDGDRAQHLIQAEKSIERLQSNGAGPNYSYERLYLDAFELKKTGTGLEFPDAKERMLKKWEKEGVAFINYIGHANPKEWGHEKLLTWNDINSMANQHLPILYAATCSFGKWDAESVSGAEVMLSNPAGGAIAVITPSRTVYIARNEAITNSVSEEVFRRDTDGLGCRIGDILRRGKNNCSSKDDNMNRYHLFGDPALRMPVAKYNVCIDSIAGLPNSFSSDAPVLKARSSVKISGKVTDADGNPVDFNGPVQYLLFDAERSVTTHGWGEDGIESVYQDRSSKLATGSTMARNGAWSTNILMPTEIANNYTPAFLTLYAYDPDLKAEATGSTDNLYVFGYESSLETDIDGPIIDNFVINSTSFKDGDVVHSNPVAIASFFDESGINISDAGIGHTMSLTLDNNTVFDDLSNYFIPDSETSGKGSIAYPLSNIKPGEHELTLIVWDNANNSSSASVKFNVGINLKPSVLDFTARYVRESDMLSLTAVTDRTMCSLRCRFECFNLNGDLLWECDQDVYSNQNSTINYSWDLKDKGANRLPRGIYIIRMHITSGEGVTSTSDRKIAIPAK